MDKVVAEDPELAAVGRDPGPSSLSGTGDRPTLRPSGFGGGIGGAPPDVIDLVSLSRWEGDTDGVVWSPYMLSKAVNI